jgi:hypothetical protein
VHPASEEYKRYYMNCLSNPARRHVDLVIENHHARLVIEGEEVPEVVIEEDFFLTDLFKVVKERTRDEVIESNRKLLEQIFLEDPEIAELVKTQRVRKLKLVPCPDELEEEAFYEYLLSYDVHHYDYMRVKPDLRKRRQRQELPSGVERFTPIGSRKSERSRSPRHKLIIVLDNGAQIEASRITKDLLRQIAAAHRPGPGPGSNLTPGWAFQRALIDLDRQEKVQKPLLISEAELLALPIVTLTDSGCSFGAGDRRFFHHKPLPMFVNVANTTGSFVTATHDGALRTTAFMHWGEADFGKPIDQQLPRVTGCMTEAIIGEESATPLHGGGGGSGRASPSVGDSPLALPGSRSPQAVDGGEVPIPGGLGAPLLSLLNKGPVDENDNPLLALLQSNFGPVASGRPDGDASARNFPHWKNAGDVPLIQEEPSGIGPIETVLGLGGPTSSPYGDLLSLALFSHNEEFGGRRPFSPRGDAMPSWKNFTQMAYGGPDMPAILEGIPELGDGDSDPRDAFGLRPWVAPSLMKTNAVVQEHLKRGDFKSLHDLLGNAGLLDDQEGLRDLPRWQPTVDFMSHHTGPMMLSEPRRMGKGRSTVSEEGGVASNGTRPGRQGRGTDGQTGRRKPRLKVGEGGDDEEEEDGYFEEEDDHVSHLSIMDRNTVSLPEINTMPKPIQINEVSVPSRTFSHLLVTPPGSPEQKVGQAGTSSICGKHLHSDIDAGQEVEHPHEEGTRHDTSPASSESPETGSDGGCEYDNAADTDDSCEEEEERPSVADQPPVDGPTLVDSLRPPVPPQISHSRGRRRPHRGNSSRPSEHDRPPANAGTSTDGQPRPTRRPEQGNHRPQLEHDPPAPSTDKPSQVPDLPRSRPSNRKEGGGVDPLDAKARELERRRMRELNRTKKLMKGRTRRLDDDLYGPRYGGEIIPGSVQFSHDQIKYKSLFSGRQRGNWHMDAYDFQKIPDEKAPGESRLVWGGRRGASDDDDFWLRRHKIHVSDFPDILDRLTRLGKLDRRACSSYSELPHPPMSPFSSPRTEGEEEEQPGARLGSGQRKRPRLRKPKPQKRPDEHPEEEQDWILGDLRPKIRIVGKQKIAPFSTRPANTTKAPTDSDRAKDAPGQQVAAKPPEESTEPEPITEPQPVTEPRPVAEPKPPEKPSEQKSTEGDEEEEVLVFTSASRDAGRRPSATKRIIHPTGSGRSRKPSVPEQMSVLAQPVPEEEEQLAAEEEDVAPSEVPTAENPSPEDPNAKPGETHQKRRQRRQVKRKPPEKVTPTPPPSPGAVRPPEDDSEYLSDLIKRTTQAVGFASLMDDDDDGKRRLQAKTRPTALGSAAIIAEIKGLAMVKPVRLRPVVRAVSDEKIVPVAQRAGEAPAQASGWTFAGRSRSPPARRRRYVRRPRMHMFGEVELVNATRIFTTFEAPSIWDALRGRIRRNSM